MTTSTGCVWLRIQHAALIGPVADEKRTGIEHLELETASLSDPVSLDEVATSDPTVAGFSSGDEPQDPPPASLALRLDEARQSAIEGNLDLRVQLMEPPLARTRVSERRWEFEPSFSLGVLRDRLDPPPGNFSFGDPPETITDTAVPGFDIPFATGGSLRFELGGARQNLPGLAGETFDQSPSMSFSQPLLRGGGLVANTSGILIAELESGIADAQTKLTAIQVLADVERAYWILYGIRAELKIREEQLELAERQLHNAERLVEAEVVSNVEVLRSRFGFLERQGPFILAQTRVRLAERNLKRIMQRDNLPVESETELLPTARPLLEGLELSRAELVEKALQNRMELLELEFRFNADSVNLAFEENSRLPRLDLRFDGRKLGTGSSLSDADRQVRDGGFSEWFLGLSAEVPLAGNQSAAARVRRAELQRQRTLARAEQQRVLITQQVLDAIDRFDQNWRQIIAARQTVASAEETFRAETRLFDLGLRTSDLVLIAATNLGDAQLREVEATLAYQFSRIEIAVATGSMLDYGRLQLGAEPPRDTPFPDSDPAPEEVPPPPPAAPEPPEFGSGPESRSGVLP